MHVLRHPGARTRALYQWENDYIFLDKRNTRFSQKDCERFVADIWRHEGRKGQTTPTVLLLEDGWQSECIKYSEIRLERLASGPVFLLHELTHAKGFGNERLTHPVSFTKEYIRLLEIYAKYDKEFLEFTAKARRLI